MDDEKLVLGTVSDSARKGLKDAHHVAAVICVAGSVVRAGDRVRFVGTPFEGSVVLSSDSWIGVVDPFLEAPVMPGQRFWCCLRPGVVSGLVHGFQISDSDSDGDDDIFCCGRSG